MRVRLKRSAVLKRIFLKDMSVSLSVITFIGLWFICLERAIRGAMGFYNDGTQSLMYFIAATFFMIMCLIECTIIIMEMEDAAEEDYARKVRAQKRKQRDRELAKKQRREQAEINEAIENQKGKHENVAKVV